MRTLIVLNGTIKNYAVCARIAKSCDRILCADGGSRHLVTMDIRPDLLIGDLDSIDNASLDWMRQKGVSIQQHPVKKDWTDSELAMRVALEEEKSPPDEIWMIGAFGQRLDHVLANIGMAERHSESVRIWLSDGAGYMVTLHGPDQITIDLSVIDTRYLKVSVLPLVTMTGVTLEGLAYPLHNAVLEPGRTLGISNEPAEGADVISISIQTGRGMVTLFPDEDEMNIDLESE